jgi:hypothetical protein
MLRVLHLGPKARHILCRTGFDAPRNLSPEGATHSIGIAAVACQPRLGLAGTRSTSQHQPDWVISTCSVTARTASVGPCYAPSDWSFG